MIKINVLKRNPSLVASRSPPGLRLEPNPSQVHSRCPVELLGFRPAPRIRARTFVGYEQCEYSPFDWLTRIARLQTGLAYNEPADRGIQQPLGEIWDLPKPLRHGLAARQGMFLDTRVSLFSEEQEPKW